MALSQSHTLYCRFHRLIIADPGRSSISLSQYFLKNNMSLDNFELISF